MIDRTYSTICINHVLKLYTLTEISNIYKKNYDIHHNKKNHKQENYNQCKSDEN